MHKLYTFIEQETDSGNILKFQVDEKANLWINDKKVLTEKRIKLRGWGLFFAGLASISSLAIATIDVLNYIHHC